MDSTPGRDVDAYVRDSGPRLKRLAFLLTGDLDAAEDLLQGAYAKVLPHWDRVSRHDDPDAYVRRVMVNLQTSWWRRHRGREITSAEPPARASGRDLANDQADLDLVLHALRTLPARQRAAVVLRHYCDLSETETAAMMGISVGGVKSQASKGLSTLRQARLRPRFPSPGPHRLHPGRAARRRRRRVPLRGELRQTRYLRGAVRDRGVPAGRHGDGDGHGDGALSRKGGLIPRRRGPRRDRPGGPG